MIRVALNTTSVDTAKMRRDALVSADDEYWVALAVAEAEDSITASRTATEHRYRAASTRAMAYGFAYSPAAVLASPTTPIEELVKRVKTVERPGGDPAAADAEALLGGAPEPIVTKTVSEAFQLYLDEIAFDEQYNKSPKQKYSWEKTKRTSVNYVIEVIGDLGMEEITREDAVEYRNWWVERMIAAEDGKKPVKPNTANRHIGNIRTLYEAYFIHIGQEERLNPFRKMFFKGESRTEVPAFEDEWVRESILVPGLFDEVRDELRIITYLLIETGCRTSEIVNLRPDDIRLGAKVPHIRIRPRQDREIKTETSVREIPLVGVALEAMKEAPNGFPHYADKGELVSANLMKAFRQRDLFPTPEHIIYSFRHAFEKRMQEANIDYGLRCTLMGHKTDRPAYGDGGSLSYRRDELMKIVHPFPEEVFAKA